MSAIELGTVHPFQRLQGKQSQQASQPPAIPAHFAALTGIDAFKPASTLKAVHFGESPVDLSATLKLTPYQKKLQKVATAYGVDTRSYDRDRVNARYDKYGRDIIPLMLDSRYIERVLKILGAGDLESVSNPREKMKLLDAALQRREDTQWTRMIDPALVINNERVQSEGIKITVRLPESLVPAKAQLLWKAEGKDPVPADEAGIKVKWASTKKTRNVDGTDYKEYKLTLRLPEGINEWGYHQLQVVDPANAVKPKTMNVIITPKAAYYPEEMKDQKLWGPTIQLYAMQQDRESAPHYQGIGDFTTLKDFSTWMAEKGASFVGVNPLSALNIHYTQDGSPYSPTSRLFMNPWYINALKVPGFEEWSKTPQFREYVASDEHRQLVQSISDPTWIRYQDMATLKREYLERSFEAFASNSEHPANAAFKAFKQKGGELLDQFATFQVMQRDPELNKGFTDLQGNSWFIWPEEYHNPSSPAVRAYAAVHAREVEFNKFLQWQADAQLTEAKEAAKVSGLKLGLYLDLPVGASKGGFDVWKYPDVYIREASTGAPPDELAPSGQNWGFPPLHPERIREVGYQPFAELLSKNMQHAGVLRIDHALGLNQLYWNVPDPTNPDDGRNGVYVKYNLPELLGVIALESQKNKCAVIGEDLGNVPQGVPEALRDGGLLSYLVGRWQRQWSKPDKPMTPPGEYNDQALATFSLHDVSTVPGMAMKWFWKVRETALGFNSEADKGLANWKSSEEMSTLEQMIVALKERQLVPKNFTLDKLKRAFDKEGLTLTDRETYNTFMAGLHRFMAETRSRMVAFQLEDVLGIVPQVNLPGTRERDEIGYQRDPDLQFYKNWRQKLPAFEVMNPELRAGSDAGKPTDESKAFELAFKAIAEGRAYAQQQAARQAQRANPFA